jgi:hypothetical protein
VSAAGHPHPRRRTPHRRTAVRGRAPCSASAPPSAGGGPRGTPGKDAEAPRPGRHLSRWRAPGEVIASAAPRAVSRHGPARSPRASSPDAGRASATSAAASARKSPSSTAFRWSKPCDAARRAHPPRPRTEADGRAGLHDGGVRGTATAVARRRRPGAQRNGVAISTKTSAMPIALVERHAAQMCEKAVLRLGGRRIALSMAPRVLGTLVSHRLGLDETADLVSASLSTVAESYIRCRVGVVRRVSRGELDDEDSSQGRKRQKTSYRRNCAATCRSVPSCLRCIPRCSRTTSMPTGSQRVRTRSFFCYPQRCGGGWTTAWCTNARSQLASVWLI